MHTFLEWVHYLPVPKCTVSPSDRTTAINHLRKEFYGLEGGGLARAEALYFLLFIFVSYNSPPSCRVRYHEYKSQWSIWVLRGIRGTGGSERYHEFKRNADSKGSERLVLLA